MDLPSSASPPVASLAGKGVREMVLIPSSTADRDYTPPAQSGGLGQSWGGCRELADPPPPPLLFTVRIPIKGEGCVGGSLRVGGKGPKANSCFYFKPTQEGIS